MALNCYSKALHNVVVFVVVIHIYGCKTSVKDADPESILFELSLVPGKSTIIESTVIYITLIIITLE